MSNHVSQSPVWRLRVAPPWFLHDVLVPYAITRLGILMVGLVALSLGSSVAPFPVSPAPWLDMWARWDSGFYLQIASAGYDYAPGAMSSVAFYPLYPLLMRALTLGSTDRQTLLIAGWFISNIASLAALGLLHALLRREGLGCAVARRTVWLMLLFPTSFFLSVVYTEGLFLLLTVAAFYCAHDGRWLAAGLLGALSAATRSIGVLLALPLGLMALQQRPRSWRSLAPALAGVALVPLGLVAYMVYLWRAFGDPLVFLHAAGAWGRTSGLQAAWSRLEELLTAPDLARRALAVLPDLCFLAAGAAMLADVLWRQPWPCRVYALYALAVPLATLQVVSIPRYMLVAFPLFVGAAARLERPWLWRVVLVICAVLQVVCVARWSLGYWVA